MEIPPESYAEIKRIFDCIVTSGSRATIHAVLSRYKLTKRGFIQAQRIFTSYAGRYIHSIKTFNGVPQITLKRIPK